MKHFAESAAVVVIGMLFGVAFYLKTPASPPLDTRRALEAARSYEARVIRDGFGVPHIYGDRDADVAFGLAYAHAEDDWKTIEEVLFFSRGTLAARKGKDAAIPDFLMGALQNSRKVNEKYETDLTPQTRAIAEAYAAGINFFCARHKGECAPGAAPVSGEDIVAGFFSRTPFFYGLDRSLTDLFEGRVRDAAVASREAFLRVPENFETGSNAMAVAPSRSADGHTRLMVNSHQPYEGPVAWYEARLKSGEGWDMIGSLFPGAPLILHGAGPALGWAFTVNKPDLVDVYRMTVDNEKHPRKYLMDGDWRDLEAWNVHFRVRIFDGFSAPIKRRAFASAHGPVFVTEHGVFGVSYAGADDIGAIEQWYNMNRATNVGEWTSAMEQLSIPSFNVIYADGEGNIGYYYNAALPVRAEGRDWANAQPGNDSSLLWRGRRDFREVPQVVNPASGYVVNANNMPFEATDADEAPIAEDFPAHYGVDRRTTNRGIRIQALYGGDEAITSDEFVSYKMDHYYADDSRVMELIRELINEINENSGNELGEARAVLQAWDGSVDKDNRNAALAVLTAQKARGYLLNDEDISVESPINALRETELELRDAFGRIDPRWGDVVRLKRGELSLELDGGPDTLRAVYPNGDLGDGAMKSVGGDTYILYADWRAPKDVMIQSIHQYGAATLDESSTHYADQAPLFASEEFRAPPMSLDALMREKTSDKVVGGAMVGVADRKQAAD